MPASNNVMKTATALSAPSIATSSATGVVLGGGVGVLASPSAAAPHQRLERTTACLPIVYGSVAFYLGKKADEYQTHQWTLYVRGANGDEDLSHVISKVVFQLHPSFAQPTRELTEPPFEVTERGWGEFEAQIRIVWKDPLEKPILLAHGIKLYPPGTPINTIPESTEPVVAETYDEVVFTDPTETFFGQLQRIAGDSVILGSTSSSSFEYSQREHFTKYSDHDICTALLEAQKFLQHELSAVKDRLLTVDAEMQQADVALREQARKPAPTSSSISTSAHANRGGGGGGTAAPSPSAAARATSATSVRPSSTTTTSTAAGPPPTKKAKAS